MNSNRLIKKRRSFILSDNAEVDFPLTMTTGSTNSISIICQCDIHVNVHRMSSANKQPKYREYLYRKEAEKGYPHNKIF